MFIKDCEELAAINSAYVRIIEINERDDGQYEVVAYAEGRSMVLCLAESDLDAMDFLDELVGELNK